MIATTVGDESILAQSAERPKAKAGIDILFLALAYVLTTIAFMEPVEYAWHRSVYDESDDDRRSEVSAREGTAQRQVFLGVLGLLSAVTLAWPGDKRLRLFSPLGLLCIAYLSWCVASCLWSDDTWMSARRIIALACEVLAGVAIATRTSPRQFAWFVLACTITWFGLGLAAELSHGALQPWRAGYRFKGVFHANIMSVACALLILSALYLSSSTKSMKRMLQGVAGIAFVFLILTGSRTALGAVLATFAVVSMLTLPAPKKLVIAGAGGLAVAAVVLAVGVGAINITTDWLSMGRQDHDVGSLSSRIPLWNELLGVYASERPFGGYGYGAFWSPTRIFDVARSQKWNPSYAHSTYVDLTLNIGIIGTVLFLITMILAFMKAVRLETRHVHAGFGFIAMVIACVLLDGTLETTFGSTWFMSFFAITAVCLLLTNVEASPQTSHAAAKGPTRIGDKRNGRRA